MHGLLPYLTEVAVRSSLLLAILLGVVGLLMRRASAAERYGVLLPGLVIVALLPLIIPLSSQFSLKWSIPWPNPVVLVPLSIPSMEVVPHPHLPQPAVTSPSSNPAEKMPALTFEQGLGALWLTGMFVQYFLLSRAIWAWRRVRIGAQTLPLSEAVQQQARLFAGNWNFPVVLISKEIRVPVLAGWWNPVVLLPEEGVHWPEERLSMVLCHELAHFRRGDTRWLPLGAWVRIVYWWHPLVWLALSRLRRERESACDDLVLSQSFRASDYANLLIGMAQRSSSVSTWQVMSLAMATSSFLGSRINAILNPTLPRRPANRGLLITGTILVLLLGGFLTAVELEAKEEAASPQIEIGLKLVEIDRDTYASQGAAIDKALTQGDLAFFAKLQGASILSGPSVTVPAGMPATIQLLKKAPYRSADGIMRTIPLGIDAQITPSFSKKGTILFDTTVTYTSSNAQKLQKQDYFQRTFRQRQMQIAEGHPIGSWIDQDAEYSLKNFLATSDQAAPPPAKRGLNLGLILTARRADGKPTPAPVAVPPPPVFQPGPPLEIQFTFVDIPDDIYTKQASVLDAALAKGDLAYFRNIPGVIVHSNPKVLAGANSDRTDLPRSMTNPGASFSSVLAEGKPLLMTTLTISEDSGPMKEPDGQIDPHAQTITARVYATDLAQLSEGRIVGTWVDEPHKFMTFFMPFSLNRIPHRYAFFVAASVVKK